MRVLMAICLFCCQSLAFGQTALEVIQRSDEKLRGDQSYAELTMTIVRPKWTREMSLKSWSKGNDLGLILVTAPARDKGTGFLKRGKEIWNWQPTISRSVKLPPSMMMQSWMGSDFTNDDLVQQSSIVHDYEHRFLKDGLLENRPCYVLELIPKEEAPVVWGKIITWISKADYLQLKSELYDEDGYLVQTMHGRDIRDLGGRLLPARLEVIPEDEEGNKTIITYKFLDFTQKKDDAFFSLQNLKRIH